MQVFAKIAGSDIICKVSSPALRILKTRMNNLSNIKIAILLIIVFVLAISAGFYFYQKQIIQKGQILEQPSSSPTANFPSSASPTPQVQGTKTAPNSQPETGTNTQDVKNIGISVTSPQTSTIISSPVLVVGRANVFEGKVIILVKDSNGNLLGQGNATACMGYDACPFEATVYFNQPSTSTGTIEVYNPSGVDGSPKYLQQILIRF